MTLKRILAIVVFIALGMAGSMFAQSDRATITGTVKDASSAVLPGVQIHVTNQGTDEVQTTTTDNAGSYRVGNLPVGNYVVTFSKNGFKTLDRKGITLLISQVEEIDVALQVAAPRKPSKSSVPLRSCKPKTQRFPPTLTAKRSASFP
jgi:Carboxypeptidase regulatory-like domain